MKLTKGKLAKHLNMEEVDHDFVSFVVNYYKECGWGVVNPTVHEYLRQKLSLKSELFLPAKVYRSLQKKFNEPRKQGAYTDKNMYDIMVRSCRQPKIHLKCVNSTYFDSENTSFPSFHELLIRSLEEGGEYIIKPARTANGKGVEKIAFNGESIFFRREELPLETAEEKILALYGKNFLIQEKLSQSYTVSQIHESSVNTLRMLTFRWEGKVHYLQSFLRVGAGGRINDNAGTGGVCVGVEDDGRLRNYFVNEAGDITSRHPTTGFNLKENNVVIKNFESYVEFVKALHNDIPHHHLVSWDIAVGADEQPIFVEHNFAGLMWLYQAATGRPIFGDLTDEVLRKMA